MTSLYLNLLKIFAITGIYCNAFILSATPLYNYCNASITNIMPQFNTYCDTYVANAIPIP